MVLSPFKHVRGKKEEGGEERRKKDNKDMLLKLFPILRYMTVLSVGQETCKGLKQAAVHSTHAFNPLNSYGNFEYIFT